MTIKGRPTDSAVLCTSSKTYSLRTVQISNELVLLRRPPSSSSSSILSQLPPSSPNSNSDEEGSDETGKGNNHLEYTETLHELMEMSVCVPRLDRIDDVLEGQRWGGLDEDGEDYEHEEERGVSFDFLSFLPFFALLSFFLPSLPSSFRSFTPPSLPSSHFLVAPFLRSPGPSFVLFLLCLSLPSLSSLFSFLPLLLPSVSHSCFPPLPFLSSFPIFLPSRLEGDFGEERLTCSWVVRVHDRRRNVRN